MNFLKYFFQLASILMIFGMLFFFGGRELWLFYAAGQVTSDARLMVKTTQWQESIGNCSSSEITGASPYQGLQLRFLDDSQYALEVDCSTRQPVERLRKKLPMGVKKTFGSAGIYSDAETKTIDGELQLEFFGRSRVVFSDGETIQHNWGKAEYVSVRPASACSAFGYVCCNSETQQGKESPLIGGVVDCPSSCFISCQQRPTLLALQTDPVLDYETRTVTIGGTSGLIIFSYAYDDTSSDISEVILEYGDGTRHTSPDAKGLITKEYVCPTGRCTYTATIHAVDTNGIESAYTRLSSITITIDPTAARF